MLPQNVAAQSRTWDGGGVDNNWGTGANWSGDIAPSPGTGSDVVFAGTSRTNPFNNYTAFDDFRNISFASGAGTFNITGNAIDLFGKIENNSTNTQTFALDLGVNTSFIEVNPVSGNLAVNSTNVFLNSNQLRVFGNNGNTLTFGAGTVISGAGGTVAINQNSTVVYQSAHTYTGDTFINAGVLRFASGSSANSSTMRLGDTTGSTAAALQVASGVTLTNGSIEVRSGSSGAKTLGYTNTSGTGTIGRTITLNSGATADVASGGTLALSGVVSGGSGLTKNGNGLLNLSASNTFSGGFTLNSGSVRITVNSAVTSGTVTSGSVGTGTLTINGGRIFAGGAGGLYVPTMLVNGDFAVNSGAFNTTDNGRLSFAGVMNLQGATRTVTLGRWTNALGTLTNQDSFRFLSNNLLAATITNGTVRFAIDPTAASGDYVGVNFAAGTVFGSGSGLTIGSNVITTMASGTPFAAGGDRATLSVESGGFFNLSDAANARNAVVRTLSGQGTVTSLANAASTSTSTLTVSNASSSDVSAFSGRIMDGNTLNADLGTSATNVSVALTKAGGGTLVLSGSNNYSGATTVSGGALRIANADALGSTASATTVAAGGALELSSGISFATENLTLNGDGIAAGGALRNVSGNNTWNGSISNNSGARINSDAGTLTIAGNISSLATQPLYIGGAGDTTINGLLTASLTTGNGALYKDGAGVLTLSANNTGLTGLVRLLGGTISINDFNALGSGTLELGALGTQGVLLVNSNGSRSQALFITDSSTNSVINVALGQTMTNSGNVTGGGNNATKFGKAGAGTLLLSGSGSTYGGQIQIGGGTLVIGRTGALGTNITTSTRGIDLGLNVNDGNESNDVALLLSNGVTLSNSIYVSPNIVNATNYARTLGLAGAGAATFNNQIYLDGNLTANADADSTLVLSGNLTNTGGLIKTGAGSLVLSASNNFSGKTIVNGGTVSVSADNRLGSPTGFVSDQLTLDGGTLATTAQFTFNTNRGVTLGAAGGSISVGAGTVLTITNSQQMVTGAGSLTKIGSGTLALGGSNNFSGGTILSAGTLRLQASSVISAGNIIAGAAGVGNVTIDGGVLQGNAQSLYATNFTLNSDFAVNAGARGVTGNGRTTLGGLFDMGGTTRTIAVGGWTNASSVLQGGIESLRFGNNTDFNANYTNGSLRFVRDAAGTASDFVSVNFTTAGQKFFGGGGFVIGSNVITTFASGSVFTNAAGVLPSITVEEGGYLNFGASNAANSQSIRSLSGSAGYVTSLANAASPSTATLTISNQAGDNSTFSGRIVDGSSLNATLGTSATNVAVALVKSGSGTQILAGDNTYSGATTIAGGTLRISGNNRLGNTSSLLTISNAGVLDVTAAGTITNAITIGAGNGVLGNSSGGTLVFAGGASKDGTVLTSRSGSGTNVFSGVISGASANSDFVVDGGTTIFSNVMTYNGPTIITNGGTLVLGVDDAMPSGSNLILGGGTFRIGVLNYNADASLSMGTLTLTENSTIDFGDYGSTGDRILKFSDSSAITWVSGKTLTITNWQGVARTSSEVTQLLFGTGGLSSASLGQIYFANQNIDGGMIIGLNNELVPVPEPRVYAATLALLAAIGWRERKRLWSLLGGLARRG